ncbi:phospholipid carrier-dependent glycosyltransferase [Leptothermofonsia sp. ETS-13]|uniref:phospholipid carrier-dependent glycosyltransferase n=1 Tax=Leptothermofonsia sp. ETS-13 TaxID=3035696 RepID=UPI003BA2ECD2
MTEHNQQVWGKGLQVLGLIWLVGAIADRLWFAIDRSIPNWDQADYLTGALNYWQALQTAQWFSSDWWTQLWQLSSKIPPLVYISTTPFLTLFGPGFDQSTGVNLVYSAILLGSVYALGVCLFSVPVGLWAAGLCLLMPGLYRVRLDYLLDYPLAAMVTLCFACLTVWRTLRDQMPALRRGIVVGHSSLVIGYDWLLAIALGLTLGLALMVKQPALLFLLVPLVWVIGEGLRQRDWKHLAQLATAMLVSLLVFGPWYRTNWLLILSSGKRATVDSAIAEGEPSLLSLEAWTYYLKLFPSLVSLPLLLVGLAGFLFFWRRSRVSSQWCNRPDYAPKPKDYQQQTYHASQRSLGWLLIFSVGGYLLSSLNLNKDTRYIVPCLPVIAVILAYGLTLLPKRWQPLRWGAVGLAGVLMIYNLFPLTPGGTLRNPIAYHPAYLGVPYPHAEVVAEVIQTEPYLQSTIGVLPSTAEVNQHNINYYGNLRNFQVYGRQVGTRLKQVEPDGRSLSWFLTKTDDQGSICQPDAQTAITQWVEQGGDFRLQKSWQLPDSSVLKLFRRRIPLLEVSPLVEAAARKGEEAKTIAEFSSPNPQSSTPTISLDQVIVPDEAPPGKPIPVTYRWSGDWEILQTGLVLLTWRKQGSTQGKAPTRWLHDHAIGMGFLHPNLRVATSKNRPTTTRYQVVERMAMLPPAATVPGTYMLEAVYLNRQTGETSVIRQEKGSLTRPRASIRINPAAAPNPAPELDLNTQLRALASALPKGSQALDRAFSEIARINQYDPVQDYVDQTRQAMEYRLEQEPQNLGFAYTLALANVLKRRVSPAIAALQRVIQIDPKNPNAYAYLAFVNLYDLRPRAAQQALNTALKLNPDSPELQALSGVAALMRGNLIQAWHYGQAFLKMQGK